MISEGQDQDAVPGEGRLVARNLLQISRWHRAPRGETEQEHVCVQFPLPTHPPGFDQGAHPMTSSQSLPQVPRQSQGWIQLSLSTPSQWLTKYRRMNFGGTHSTTAPSFLLLSNFGAGCRERQRALSCDTDAENNRTQLQRETPPSEQSRPTSGGSLHSSLHDWTVLQHFPRLRHHGVSE